jgi:hypothetical protein
MLNKKVCRQCHRQYGLEFFDDNDEDFDKRWEGLTVLCPQRLVSVAYVKIGREKPLSWCPFQLEHTLSNQNVE